jgi:aquaporin Z
LLGTFASTLAVLLSLMGTMPLPTSVVADLSFGIFVYIVGHISGAHFNPAITLGIFSVKKIGITDAFWYIVSQFLGAILGFYLAHLLIDKTVTLTVTDTLKVGTAELIGTFVFAFGFAAVLYKKVSSSLSGLVIGGSLLLGILIAGTVSNGVLNPAIALGIGSFSPMYVIGPVIGSILGMWTFKILASEK